MLGPGTRLQIMQNKKVQKITSYREIDLTLPGRENVLIFVLLRLRTPPMMCWLRCLCHSFVFNWSGLQTGRRIGSFRWWCSSCNSYGSSNVIPHFRNNFKVKRRQDYGKTEAEVLICTGFWNECNCYTKGEVRLLCAPLAHDVPSESPHLKIKAEKRN